MLKRNGGRQWKQIRGRKVKASGATADEPLTTGEKGGESGGGSKDDTAASRRSVRAFLIGAVQAAVIIPVLFYLHFGEIDAFALSFTGFIVVLCLLVALGFSIPDRPEYQTPIRA